MDRKRKLKDNEDSDIESSPKRRKSYTVDFTIVTCNESSHIYMYSLSYYIMYVLVAWVGVNSRWGSIISIYLFDWGSIRIFVGLIKTGAQFAPIRYVIFLW